MDAELRELHDRALLERIYQVINAAVAAIRQDIADIKAANPNIDTSALEAWAAGLEALDAENPPPTG